mgnify:CR=1 FL=1
MPELNKRTTKFYSRGDKTVTINAAQGHFATSNCHVNYYVDVTRLKIRVGEARDAALALKNLMKMLFDCTHEFADLNNLRKYNFLENGPKTKG